MACFKAGLSSIPYFINNLESGLFLYAIVFSTGMNLFDELATVVHHTKTYRVLKSSKTPLLKIF